MRLQKFYGIRIVLRTDDWSETYSRDYVRGEKRMGVKQFTRWAVGDFLGLVTDDKFVGVRVSEIFVITPAMAQENRKYGYTTH